MDKGLCRLRLASCHLLFFSPPQGGNWHGSVPRWCSPFRGRQHLLIRLISHDVVNNLEAAVGAGKGKEFGGEKVVHLCLHTDLCIITAHA